MRRSAGAALLLLPLAATAFIVPGPLQPSRPLSNSRSSSSSSPLWPLDGTKPQRVVIMGAVGEQEDVKAALKDAPSSPIRALFITPSERPAHPPAVRKQPSGPPSNIVAQVTRAFRTGLFALFALSPLSGAFLNGPADAASGGRLGGSGFRSAPSMTRRYTPPSRSYSSPSPRGYYAPPQTRQYTPSPSPYSRPSPYRGYVDPFMMPGMPFSPYRGLGLGLGPMSPGMTIVSSRGLSPIDVIIVGAVAAQALSILRRSRMGGASTEWDLTDADAPPSSLGDGVTVLKIQVGLNVMDRSAPNSILGQLDNVAKTAEVSSRGGLSQLVSSACLSLLRSSDDWVSANGDVRRFARGSEGKAESEYQRTAINERSKFETEGDMTQQQQRRPPASYQDVRSRLPYMVDQRPTMAVVTLCVAIRGQHTTFNRLSSTGRVKEALQVLAADALTDDGENVLATEVLWTPQDDADILTQKDVITLYPELINL